MSLTKIPPDDVPEGLYILRIREFDQLKTVFELYDMEIHQKIFMPDHQKWSDDGKEKWRTENSTAKC